MEHKIESTIIGTTRDGKNVRLFRIPNNTNDYIEVSAYGCTIQGIYIHNKGVLQNMLCGFNALEEYEQSQNGTGSVFARFFSGAAMSFLTHKVWDVAELGDNYVFLFCKATAEECGLGCGLALGARIMWVNLNRLVIDLFMTPEKDISVRCACGLPFRLNDDLAGYSVRTFCPLRLETDGTPKPVSETPYGGLAFQQLGSNVESFIHDDPNIKPMAELANTAAGMTISAYGTMNSIQIIPDLKQKCVILNQSMMENITLTGEASFSYQVIYGFDPLYTPEEIENPERSPFGAFFAAGQLGLNNIGR